MRQHSFACAVLGLSIPILTSDSIATGADGPRKKQEAVVGFTSAGSPDELAPMLAKLLSSAARSELDRLVCVPDCTAAVAAGWERVRRTMPEIEHEDTVSPDLLEMSRFLGLVEGRIQVPVPKTWAETLKSAVGHAQNNLWFPPRPDLALLGRKNEHWSLERNGASWLAKKGLQSIKLPEQDASELGSYATVECAGKWAYVALFDDVVRSPYRLFAIDQDTGRIQWSSRVWGTSRVRSSGVIVPSGGSDWHIVAMRSSSETLVVFGFSSGAVYMEAFDRKTGQNRCRFSTAYFVAAPERDTPKRGHE